MKKFLAIAFVLCFVMLTSYAHATLIGLQAGPTPDILVNTTGTVNYVASTGAFSFTAEDETITYAVLPKEYLSGSGYTTAFTLSGYVNAFGNWTGGITGYDMTEIVTNGFVTIKGVTYGVGTTLLSGEVKAFGWANYGSPSSVPKFDFLIDKNTIGGVLTTQVAPPDLPWSTAYDTGIIATGETGTVDFSKDFTITRIKGDKFPLVPEPGTLLLLGAGLVGLAGYSRFRLQRKKK